MKKWGLLVSSYYTITVIAFFWPLFWSVLTMRYNGSEITWQSYLRGLSETWGNLWFAIPLAVVFLGQFLLLFISVDTSHRRLKPRASIFLPAALTGLFTALLGFGIVTSIFLAATGDKFFDYLDQNHLLQNLYLVFWPLLWIVWAVIFYFYARNADNPVARAMSWLLKGSILEFLVVIPCHVIVRRRDDCCAPMFTSLGLCTGLAIMFLAFGPSVLLLYKKRMASYTLRDSRAS